MKTKIEHTGAVVKAAGMMLALLLPGVLAAQPAKTLTIHGEAPPEPPAPPALKEETFLGISTHSVDAALAGIVATACVREVHVGRAARDPQHRDAPVSTNRVRRLRETLEGTR